MAEGNKTTREIGVPLNGESEIKQITAATDILTLTGASGQTGDFLVCQNSSGTEKFVFDVNGKITAAGGVGITAGSYLNIGSTVSTAPTTGLTKGDLFLFFSNSSPQLAVCTSTAANTLKYISPFDTKTIGRSS